MVDKIKKTGQELNKLNSQFDAIIEEAKGFTNVDYGIDFVLKIAKINNEISNKRILECNKKCLNKNKNIVSFNQVCLENCYNVVIDKTNMISGVINNINSDMI